MLWHVYRYQLVDVNKLTDTNWLICLLGKTMAHYFLYLFGWTCLQAVRFRIVWCSSSSAERQFFKVVPCLYKQNCCYQMCVTLIEIQPHGELPLNGGCKQTHAHIRSGAYYVVQYSAHSLFCSSYVVEVFMIRRCMTFSS